MCRSHRVGGILLAVFGVTALLFQNYLTPFGVISQFVPH